MINLFFGFCITTFLKKKNVLPPKFIESKPQHKIGKITLKYVVETKI